MREWSKEEKKSITDLLKKVPAADRPAIRDAVKDMQADEAISYIKGMKAPNKPLKASEGTSTPEKTQDAGDQGKIIVQDQVKLERVQGDIVGSDFNIDVIRSDIQAMINTFTSIHGIEDLTKAPQRQFMALSSYIGQNYFKHTKILKDNTLIDNGSARPSTCDRYDTERLAEIISLYYDICALYNKAFLYDGVASFIGCSENTLRENSEKLTSFGIDLNQKRESSLSAGAVDPKTTNITGLLAALNHWHGWSGASATRTEVRETTVVYPVLVDINKSNRETIPDKQSQ